MNHHSSNDASSEPDPLGLLADEFLERYRRGERPTISEYTQRSPELAGELRKLLRALVVMEDVRPDLDLTIDLPGRSSEPVQRLDEYRIVREIGRGGMGVVYEAEQESLGRRVAIKVLPPGIVENERQLQRFRREARAAARLHHTNIVPVFGVGDDGGTFYYVMQYIDGRPLDQVLVELRRLRNDAARPTPPSAASREDRGNSDDPSSLVGQFSAADVALSLFGQTQGPERPDPPQEAEVDSSAYPDLPGPRSSGSAGSLAGPHRHYAKNVAHVGVQVAEALGYAAAQGVLHRDVKPSNLLLDVWGTTWLTDFGLAKATGTADLTAKDDLLGTLRYMAPERFEGRADIRSDLYALGLTLYEMLALRPAFDETAHAHLARQITASAPPRLDKIAPELPRDLVTIVHKAIARDAGDRYQLPGAMADDLRRFLDDRPIAARRSSLIEQAWRWCRRNPTGAALVVTALALLVLAIGGGAWQLRQAAERRAEAEHESQEIRTVLSQVDGLRQQGRTREALAVMERLEGSGSVELRRRVGQARGDLALADRLESIGLERTNHVAGDFKYEVLANEYEQAFRKAGLALNDTNQAELAIQIRGSAIKDQLVAALDDWAFVAFILKNEDLCRRLLALARATDPDPSWRDRFRDPATWRSRRTLEGLAKEAPVADLSPPLLVVLGSLLELEGADAEPILRAAQQYRPSHFWINWELGTLLMNKKKPGEAVGFFRAALAMRPESGAVYKKLARALQDCGLAEQSARAHRRASELGLPDEIQPAGKLR
jgi:serine/threonine protein kinase